VGPAATDLASRLVRWQASHGRHDLPWQNTRDPYRVWLSEIMLQQTQVATVKRYFERFMQRFPDVRALAGAHLDEVLALWSGLGYYSRARNLHACAQAVVREHGGEFPRSADLLQTLPGIGRSTSAAVAAICFGERVAILDGNVKRVLTRALGFGGDLAQSANERELWNQAQALLPTKDLRRNMPRYTQAVMDLGASLCNARKPVCGQCPLAGICVANQQGRQTDYPVKTRKLKRSAQSLWLLWAQNKAGAVWLSQRPTPGVWAGLYCFELFDSREALAASLPAAVNLQDETAFKHVLTHKDLYLHPVRVQVPVNAMRGRAGQWHAADAWPKLGLPAPIRTLLSR
jgi:A/G-specific adenine glycosylase